MLSAVGVNPADTPGADLNGRGRGLHAHLLHFRLAADIRVAKVIIGTAANCLVVAGVAVSVEAARSRYAHTHTAVLAAPIVIWAFTVADTLGLASLNGVVDGDIAVQTAALRNALSADGAVGVGATGGGDARVPGPFVGSSNCWRPNGDPTLGNYSLVRRETEGCDRPQGRGAIICKGRTHVNSGKVNCKPCEVS